MTKESTKKYYLDTPKGGSIAKELFKEYTNQTAISKLKHPKSKEIHPYINKLFNLWKKKNWIVEKIIGYKKRKNKSGKYSKHSKGYPLKRYRLNLNFFFDYAQNKGVKFTKLGKEFLEFLFSFDNIRKGVIQKDKTLIESFEYILTKIFLLDEEKGEASFGRIPLRYVALHCFERKKGEKIIDYSSYENKYSKMLSSLEMNIMKLLKLKLEPLIKEDYFGGLDFGSEEDEDEIYSASLEAMKEIKFN